MIYNVVVAVAFAFGPMRGRKSAIIFSLMSKRADVEKACLVNCPLCSHSDANNETTKSCIHQFSKAVIELSYSWDTATLKTLAQLQ